jgi:opacity protein-like surface antigen
MRLITLAAAAALLATPVAAADANAIGAQGTTFLELTVDSDQGGDVKAVFRFASGEWDGGRNLTVPPGRFAMKGRFEYGGKMVLIGDYWIQQPAGYAMVNLDGVIQQQDDGKLAYHGRVNGAPSCTEFFVIRR